MSRETESTELLRLKKENEELKKYIEELKHEENTRATIEILKSRMKKLESRSLEKKSDEKEQTKDNINQKDPLYQLLEKIFDKTFQSLSVILRNQSTSNYDGITLFSLCGCELPAFDLDNLRNIYSTLEKKDGQDENLQSYSIDSDGNLHLTCIACKADLMILKNELFTDFDNVKMPISILQKIQRYFRLLEIKKTASQDISFLMDFMDEVTQTEYSEILINLIKENSTYLDLKDTQGNNIIFFILKNKNKNLFFYIKKDHPQKFIELCLQKNNKDLLPLTAMLNEFSMDGAIQPDYQFLTRLFQESSLNEMVVTLLESKEINYLSSVLDEKTVMALFWFFSADKELKYMPTFIERLKESHFSSLKIKKIDFMPKPFNKKSVELVELLIKNGFLSLPLSYDVMTWLEGLGFEDLNDQVLDFIQLVLEKYVNEEALRKEIVLKLKESAYRFLDAKFPSPNNNLLPDEVLNRYKKILLMLPRNQSSDQNFLLLKNFLAFFILISDNFFSKNICKIPGQPFFICLGYQQNCLVFLKNMKEYYEAFEKIKVSSENQNQYQWILKIINGLISSLSNFDLVPDVKAFKATPFEINEHEKHGLNQLFSWLLPILGAPENVYIHQFRFFQSLLSLAINQNFLSFCDKKNEPILFQIKPLLENESFLLKLYELISPLKEDYNCADLFFRIGDIYSQDKKILSKFISLVDYRKLDNNQINSFSRYVVKLELKNEIQTILKTINNKQYKNEIVSLKKKLIKSPFTDEVKEELTQKLPGFLLMLCEQRKENWKKFNDRKRKRKSASFGNGLYLFPEGQKQGFDQPDAKLRKHLAV